jgi:hypothetical protein
LIIVVVALDSLNVEFGEWEYLGELAIFEVFLSPQLLAGSVDDVSTLVNKVTFFVYSAAEVVDQILL